jgi:predicted N-formylglutamate amidohydrolase
MPFLHRRRDALSPLLLTCEHASRALPFSRGVSRRERRFLATHWGWDIGAWALTCELTDRLGLEAIGGRWTRLLIDLNRRAGDPTLVRRHVEGVELSWNRGLDPAEVERRLADFHTPYHVALDGLILHRLVRDVRPILLAVHSFTPTLDGRARPFEIGVLYGRDLELGRRFGRALRRRGLTVRYNQPYSGLAGMMYSVDRHGTHHGLPCLELEVSQRIAATRRQVARLAAAVAPVLAELIESRPSRARSTAAHRPSGSRRSSGSPRANRRGSRRASPARSRGRSPR